MTKLSLSDKVAVIQSVSLHEVILKALGELSQFRDGLESLGVVSAIKNNKNLLR